MKEEIDIIIQDKSFFSIRKIETVSINKKKYKRKYKTMYLL